MVRAGERQIESNKIKFFIPNEKQEEFIRAKAYTKLFQAANRCGKTAIGIVEVISYCLGYRPYLSPTDPDYKIRFTPPIKARVYGEDFAKHIGEVLVPKLYEWIPASEFTYYNGNPKKNQTGIPTYWEFNNGSVIELLSYEQDPAKSEGWEGHIVHFDEPPRRETYIAAKRGLVVSDGDCILTMTPLKEPWIYDEIWSRKTDDVFAMSAEMTDNLRHRRDWWRPDGDDGMAWTGVLTKEAINRYAADLSDDEKQARLFGRNMHLCGLVYKEFIPSVHICKWFSTKSQPYTFYEAIDPATRKPTAVTFMAVSQDGKKYIADEIFIQGTVKDIALAIVEKRKFLGYKKPGIPTIIDPLAVSIDPITGTTQIDEYMKYGVFCQTGSKDRSRGIQLLKEELKRDENERPGIYVMEHCRRTVHEFLHYIWDDNKITKTQKDTPKKVNDDMLENIHRLLIAGVKYKEMAEHKYKRQVFGVGHKQ